MIKQIKKYFNTMYKSISDPIFMYKKRNNITKAGHYFLFLILAGSIVSVVILIGFSYTFLITTHDDAVKKLSDVSVVVGQEQFELSGVDQPFTKTIVSNSGDAFTVYIDTQVEQLSPQDEALQDISGGMVIISQNEIILHDKQNGWSKSISHADVSQQLAGKDIITLVLDKARSFLTPGGLFTAGVVFVLILFILNTISQLLYIAIIAGISLPISKKLAPGWTYKQLFVVGMYAFTASFIVNHVLPVNVPILMSVVFIYIMYLVIKQKPPVKHK